MVRINVLGRDGKRSGYGFTDRLKHGTVYYSSGDAVPGSDHRVLRQRVVCDADRELTGMLSFSICDSKTHMRH